MKKPDSPIYSTLNTFPKAINNCSLKPQNLCFISLGFERGFFFLFFITFSFLGFGAFAKFDAAVSFRFFFFFGDAQPLS